MKAAKLRPPAVAGMFYPSSAYELQSDVEAYMARGHKLHPAPRPKALIVPHAGYPYSGPVAGSAFRLLIGLHKEITRVILIGPCHRVAFRGMALAGVDAFQTPLGDVPVDHNAERALAHCEHLHVDDRTHREEHSLEVELPFLQCALDAFTIIPVVVGDATGREVAEVIEALWGGPETLIVISSDLSHYLPYAQAQALDRLTANAIIGQTPELIEPEMACGRLAIQGLLIAAGHHGLRATLIDLRNSGDTAGDKSQVVGYGAFVFST